ncbi:alanine acetyltransferase [Paenibacillus odorifer]|uniref:Alanine acetyltransferase n=1 Tax=Paenibacillus odorifer TaxID=189426 RepID=A0AAD0KK06_9BACL|nr:MULTISPECIES: GNAT family protein [Paenibacillus]AWV33205.1 alanine acetyltransferase [Paenibacillus odorifer]MDH6426714.1 ribosomal-protein-alanine N-acetyltransferase [Paenibacillus sp. PastH-4]MDH6442739.1 ribosomal-protein-alanine N-acetyltransferase [Paenibacillus sp. PastF-4]MDH6526550.1 ribosomal-protein-alanine N-acetyltransferase [Paenibacillus sp. PastH-3]OMD57850.1 alanine acetyltransferase [Paenibacillus odorifer]
MKLSHVFEQFPTLESEQLLLKKIEVSNLDEVFGIYSNDQVFEYCGIIPKHNKDTVKNMIGHFERDFTKGVRVKWGIFLKNNPYILLGIIEVMDFNQKVDMVTIGYFLAEPYWGKGIAAQAIQLVVKYLFETAEVNRIQAEVMPFNERSKRVLLKNGFTKEGTLRQAHVWSGKGLVDLEIYSILAEEYFASIGKPRVSNRM